MNLFNSLGSNYSFTFALGYLGLWLRGDTSATKTQVEAQLSALVSGAYTFTTQGRQALSLALVELGIKPGDRVAVQGFTCYAVESSLHSIGAEPVFVDVAKQSLNPGLAEIDTSFKRSPFKALVIQHTLGYAMDMTSLKHWCHNHEVLLVEDMAHALGGLHLKHRLGSFGDGVALSFGRDKIVDVVTGGAYRINPKLNQDMLPEHRLPLKIFVYPLLTQVIRATYPIGLGKLIHRLCKYLGLIYSPVGSISETSCSLDKRVFPALKASLEKLERDIVHRRQIAAAYHTKLKSSLITDEQIASGTCLRYPLLVENRQQVLRALESQGVHVSDTWYRQVVDASSLKVKSSYVSGTCPNAQLLAEQIINLPTHRYVTLNQANQMAQFINDQL